MTLYAMFEPKFGRTDAPAAVPEKFHWLAAILPPVFFALHGLWLELIGFAIWVVALAFARPILGGDTVNLLYVVSVLWLGLAAASIRRGALKRAGWRYRAEITAPASDIAQLVWLKLGRT